MKALLAVAGLVAIGGIFYLALRKKGASLGTALTGPPAREVAKDPRTTAKVYGYEPGYAYAPPQVPLTAETNPKNAKRSGFVDDCGGALQVGGSVAALAGGPKGAAVGTALVVGAPYACKGLHALGKAGAAVGSFFKKLF